MIRRHRHLHRVAVDGGDNMLKLDLDLKKVTQKLDGITQASKEAVRPAAQAGAQVLYERARQEAPVSKAAHMFHIGGRVYGPFKPGNLRDSIYQVYAQGKSTSGKATYEISFNHDKAPYGFTVLRGRSGVAANDFIGRAYDVASTAAALVVKTRLEQGIKKAK